MSGHFRGLLSLKLPPLSGSDYTKAIFLMVEEKFQRQHKEGLNQWVAITPYFQYMLQILLSFIRTMCSLRLCGSHAPDLTLFVTDGGGGGPQGWPQLKVVCIPGRPSSERVGRPSNPSSVVPFGTGDTQALFSNHIVEH